MGIQYSSNIQSRPDLLLIKIYIIFIEKRNPSKMDYLHSIQT